MRSDPVEPEAQTCDTPDTDPVHEPATVTPFHTQMQKVWSSVSKCCFNIVSFFHTMWAFWEVFGRGYTNTESEQMERLHYWKCLLSLQIMKE